MNMMMNRIENPYGAAQTACTAVVSTTKCSLVEKGINTTQKGTEKNWPFCLFVCQTADNCDNRYWKTHIAPGSMNNNIIWNV